MIDFSYNGEKLSDYGCMVVSINTSFSNSVPLGSNLVFETIKNRANHHNKIVNTTYEDIEPITFDICKNPCQYKTQEEMIFEDGEISHFMRWLNQKKYYKFKPIYEDGMYSDLYFYGTFKNISAIVVSGNVVGLTLTFKPNSPFGYVDDKEYVTSISKTNGQFLFYDDSDEIGSMYPYLFQIECLADGKLRINNDRETKFTVIDNCTNGEIITLDCVNKIIQSNKPHPTIYNDFNYNYPKIMNDLESRRNVFTVSIPCNIKIKYAPTRKAGIIV